MGADGSNPTNLTNSAAFDTAPAWSPDGSKLAIQSNRITMDNEIWLMDADGSDAVNLTQTPGNDDQPAWSPDGTKIAFQSERDTNAEVYVMNPDGSGQVNLTQHAASDGGPSWSPDGTKIIFTSDRTGDSEVFMMNPDGSGVTNLTNNAALDGVADWQRVSAKKVTLKAKPRAVDAGDRVTLKAKVKPCDGHEGDVVEFYRKKKRIATKKSNQNCLARLKVKVTRTTKFRAVSPEQDLDHLAGTSKPVKVKILKR
jgi:dipeptidyl aminopeptidase/acylaminoacyl peptidase